MATVSPTSLSAHRTGPTVRRAKEEAGYITVPPMASRRVPATHDQGNQAGAGFGASVATAGDVNGDGYSDVIVGAPLFNNGKSEEGMVWVWHGSEDGLSELHDWHAEANLVDASFGQSVATAGDVNRDGYADIIVGATRYTAGQYWEGAAFVWLGSENGVNNECGRQPHKRTPASPDRQRLGPVRLVGEHGRRRERRRLCRRHRRRPLLYQWPGSRGRSLALSRLGLGLERNASQSG